MNTIIDRFGAILLSASLLTPATGLRASETDEAMRTRGQALYAEQMCNLCHTRDGASGPMAHVGGSLDGLAAKRDAAWVEAYLRDPPSVIPSSQMLKSTLTDQQLAELIAFLLGP
ncbi:MAG: cytochrome c [Chromatiales bacterium]|nr:cytochrome c [Chromatiales bacterium]